MQHTKSCPYLSCEPAAVVDSRLWILLHESGVSWSLRYVVTTGRMKEGYGGVFNLADITPLHPFSRNMLNVCFSPGRKCN